MRRRSFLPGPALAIALTAGNVLAAWPPGGIHLERPAPAASSGIPDIGPDGQGGTFIVWPESDSSGVLAFRVHRLTFDGAPPAGWTTAGVRAGFLPNRYSWVGTHGVLPDGTGGAYFYWTDYAGPARVLRIAPEGGVSPGWPASGVAVASTTGLADLVATDDGAGGVLLAWRSSAIVTQRFLPDGSRAAGFPADGLAITSGSGQPARPRLVRDADRGFWISFASIGDLSVPSIYAVAHLDPSGLLSAGQQPNGLALSLPAGEVGGAFVALALDGEGGVFAFTLGTNGIVRAFHVTSSFAEDDAWPPGGLVLASGAGWPSVHFPAEERWPVAAGDLAGSAYVGWRNPSDFLLHGCRVNIDGTIATGWSGAPVVAGEMMDTFVADAGGLFSASLDPYDCPHFNCTGPLLVARMSSSGQVAAGWPSTNPPYSDAPGVSLAWGTPHDLSTLVADGLGGVVIAWVDYSEYYAMRFLPPPSLAGVGPTALVGAVSVRGRFDPDAGVRVTFALDRPAEGRLDLFDLAGRRLASESFAGESGEITLAGTRGLPAGLCFVRLATKAQHGTAKVLIAR